MLKGSSEEYQQLSSDADESYESEGSWLKHPEFAWSFFFLFILLFNLTYFLIRLCKLWIIYSF